MFDAQYKVINDKTCFYDETKYTQTLLPLKEICFYVLHCIKHTKKNGLRIVAHAWSIVFFSNWWTILQKSFVEV